MSDDKNVFGRHDEAQQKQYEREARLQYGPGTVNESIKRWNNYTSDEQDAIMAEGNRIYTDVVKLIEAGKAPDSKEMTEILDRWQQHLHHFYEPTLEILAGLGELYNTNPDFIRNFQKLHVDLPAYLQQAIAIYVDELETAAIERMLAEDEADMNRRTNNLSS